MKRILPLFFVLVIGLLISSCAVQPVQKRLIGTWKAVKIEPFTLTGTPITISENIRNGPRDRHDSTDLQPKPNNPSKVEQQVERMVQSELRSTMTVNENKTAIKEYPGKTVHATWKLKNKGTTLVVKTKETDKTMTLYIQHITDTSAVFTTTSPVGKFKITYKKEKKQTAN
jgi:hypothetical protein